MTVEGFVLVNGEKVERAKYGAMSREGKLVGGVGEDAAPAALLAEYDRLGGLVLKDGVKVRTGSFYDFEARAPRKEPKLTFEASLDGEVVEVTEGEAKAIKATKEKQAKLKKSKKKKKKE